MDTLLKPITRALISVSDKTGLAEFAQRLAAHNIELVSTGGTAKLLRGAGLTVRDVSDLTGFPEMLDGRVKTLHPKIHGGILGIRANAEHQAKMAEYEIAPIDLVIINLYPFRQTIQKLAVALEEAIENIDIGGPAMIRSAAKNHADVAVVVDPADYEQIAAQLDAQHGALTGALREQLALTAFRHTAAYDAEIARFLGTRFPATPANVAPGVATGAAELPDQIALSLEKAAGLRYGENPHQRAALYRIGGSSERGVANAEQLQGKELSYNNLIDSDAAWELVMELKRLHLYERQLQEQQHGKAVSAALPHACAIIKHTNPCGVGVAETALAAFEKAKATDPVSAFGGIIAFTNAVDADAAQQIAEMFAEVIIAPSFTDEAKRVLAAKKNLRVLAMGEEQAANAAQLEFRKVSGGVLVQEKDAELLQAATLQVVSQRQPTEEEWSALRFAWAICKHVKSNAIVYAKHGQLVGVGAGQMSRVDSVKLGANKAHLDLKGSVLASDAFFPFRDGVDEATKHGITAIIQPGGSLRDQDTIAAANEHGLALVLTGMRHFKH